jgi:hypothetical protein
MIGRVSSVTFSLTSALCNFSGIRGRQVRLSPCQVALGKFVSKSRPLMVSDELAVLLLDPGNNVNRTVFVIVRISGYQLGI